MRSTTIDMETDRAAIRAKLADIVAAHNAADAEAWASATSDDIVLMVDGGPSVTGRRGIIEWVKAFYAANRISNMATHVEEIEIAGDLAYTRERFTATLTPSAGGASVRMDGKEIGIWRRQPDGQWRVSRAIFNSNVPPVAPGPGD
jgi:uncharacterized protein (TIGR02246 family)